MIRVVTCGLFLAGLVTLLSLGTWQYQRLHWKNGIIDTLENQYANLDEKNATLTVSQINSAIQNDNKAFIVDKLSGRIARDKITYIGPQSRNGTFGHHVIAPVDTGDGYILADLGWIRDQDRAALSLPQRHILLHGVARIPDYSRFTSKNSPENNLWFQTDITQIAAAKNLSPIAPMVFFAQTSIDEKIVPHDSHWLPRNKHRQYMLFWFGMAVCWIGVFALAYVTRARSAINDTDKI